MKPEIILKLLKITKSTKKSAGFTLIELLVAAIITSIIVSIAGWGLVTLMSSKKVADTQTAMQGETNRAADFINDEIRRAKFINKTDTITSLSGGTTLTASGYTGTSYQFNPSGKSIVLALQIPDAGDTNTDDETVIYYVKDNDTNWRGPKVIYRWGPTFNQEGEYKVTTNNLSYTSEPLIDSISNTVGICSSGTIKGDTGFYTCLGGQQGSGTSAYYTSAQIYINGLFKKPGDTYYSTGNSKTDTKAVSRINQNPATVPTTNALSSSRVSTSRDVGTQYKCSDGTDFRVTVTVEFGTASNKRTMIINDKKDPTVVGNGEPNSPEFPNKKVQLQVNSDTPTDSGASVPLIGKDTPYKIEKQGSDLVWINSNVTRQGSASPYTYKWADGSTAGIDDYQGKVRITANATPVAGATCSNAPPGGGISNYSGTGNSATATSYNGNRIVSLFNDDSLPTDATDVSVFAEQRSAETEINNDLKDHDSDGYADTDTNKEANLGDNEVIVMWELGQTTSGQNGFDLNDKIVKLSW